MTDQTPSPQSVVPVGPKRVLVLKSAVERLILAADMYGVAHLDSDDMDDDAVELQDATEGMKDALAAAPTPLSLAGGGDDFAHDLARTLDRYGLKDAGWSDADIADALEMVGEPSGVSQATVKAIMPMIEARLAALSPEAPAEDGGWIEADKRPDTTGDLWLAVDAAGKLFPGVFVNHRIPAEAALVQRVVLPGQVALTPRHEAPASHSFEASHSVHREGGCKVCGHDEASHEAPAEGAGERVYIDCEFDGHNGPLLSVALVRESGDSIHIRADVEPMDLWVRQNVLPLMDSHKAARSEKVYAYEVGGVIRSFLGEGSPVIVCDSPQDARYFSQALTTAPDGGYAPFPFDGLTIEVLGVDAYPTTLEGAVQHNAWWDAMALREALRARSSAPEAREGDRPFGYWVDHKAANSPVFIRHGSFVPASDHYTITKLYTHPAAPSADKLRIAVEALETSRENLIGWFEAIDAEIRVEHEMHVSLKDDLAVIDQALATLEAEGKS